MKRFLPILAAAAATLAAVAGSVPAQAAQVPGWRVVFAHHYGPKSDYSAYDAVAGLGTRDLWAFGTTNAAGLPAPGVPVAEHWNGAKWRASALPRGLKSEIVAADASSPRSVWAVTEVGDILGWNGARWTVSKHVANGGLFTAISAINPRDVWAFGASPAGPGAGAWHFNGKTWKQARGVASTITDASAVSATDIWAVTVPPGGQSILRYNGHAWRTVRVQALPAGSYVEGILALSRANVWATVSSPSCQDCLAHLVGGKWALVKPRWPVDISGGLAPDGRGGLWAVGYSGKRAWVMHRSAKGRWTRFATAERAQALTRIPGSAGLLGVGEIGTNAGAIAAVWAHGRI